MVLEMRKLLVLVLSAAMLIGGLYLVGVELFLSRIMYWRLVIGGTILATMGAYLLWTDFLAPKLNIRTWED